VYGLCAYEVKICLRLTSVSCFAALGFFAQTLRAFWANRFAALALNWPVKYTHAYTTVTNTPTVPAADTGVSQLWGIGIHAQTSQSCFKCGSIDTAHGQRCV
jgi:hypothetical protein